MKAKLILSLGCVRHLDEVEGFQIAGFWEQGSPFAPDSETNEPPLRPYQLWKKARYEEALRKSDQMYQTCEKSSLAMTHKLDDMIELPKSQPKKTYEEDLECVMVWVEMPRCIAWDKVILDEESPEVLWIFTWTILG
ncbi:hypothetical protein Tco_0838421 [Tanacetum coccineum]|uniref:Uncharacterized protein n=1 Tax=Tanacetum coccineum TaxID=301880 RepID=A0ABQ5AS97_9ASTR